MFLTREFKNLGGEDQVLRALRKLVITKACLTLDSDLIRPTPAP